jgi:hypothetical protein
MEGHSLRCPNCDHSIYIFYMSEGKAQKITSGVLSGIRPADLKSRFWIVTSYHMF